MFSKILIANRGEIACRVIRTARRMGIATVAVFSEADAEALHVAMADEARPIGPPPARDSYLNAAAIVAAAKAAGAEAIHPGYGFLAENAGFAEACAASGLVFIGPPPAAMRAMGSKAAAKALMEAAGVPVVPGYHGADQDPEHLAAEASKIGFPVLIKASGGGGGRGMRIVNRPVEFSAALDSAKREALSAFGDDRVLIEKYLAAPRHIELQVFADAHGNVVHLFERDCSIQRRYQKVVEEAPAPGLPAAMRTAMGEAAVAAARAVGYVGAGTVEFIADMTQGGGRFYFMEMNTRLQVEHPVTEAVTGTDLVEWQLRVAAGEAFTRTQADIALNGHAIEVRLYAEDPARGFLPATGTLHRLRLPEGAARVETGVREGDRVTPHYDPMIAKIVAWGRDREAARTRLEQALAETGVLGVATNLGFLARIAGDPDFAAARLDTGFIERRKATLLAPPPAPPDAALALAALTVLGDRPTDGGEPWARRDGWRLNAPPAPQTLVFSHAGEALTIEATACGDGWELRIGERTLRAAATIAAGGAAALSLDGVRSRALALAHEDTVAIFAGGESWRFERVDPLAPASGADASGGRLSAPMPGRVVQLLVGAGDAVRQGQPLIVIEAMKMEHTIAAPRDGVVERVRYAVGDLVEEGAELIALDDPAAAAS
ncbi:MAG TPA: acetyl/propionyl/methylcrotonyl-CoA carboxylase subunit alpha [Stellaceae bacterium]|nr:acetyl/propionyl/methylcrotonyl-CoA carboxylase subunit alpha [Stellaceae bacterium]